MTPERVEVNRKVAAKGHEVSLALRARFREAGTFVVNLIGSPGAGKTTLLEAIAPRLRGRAAVIEGDLRTDQDKRRIERTGLPAFQVNTIGACHLDAEMVRAAVEQFQPPGVEFLFIENVGNLVCPASFEIGEDVKVAVISTAEGDDKPSKYPVALAVSAAMVVTKVDLLPYLRCDVERMERDARDVNPAIAAFRVASTTGDGADAFVDWLQQQREAVLGR